MAETTQEVIHRGLRLKEQGSAQRLPNSFEAILKAEKGQIVEMDVFLLSDGSLAMAHHKDLSLEMDQVEAMQISDFQALFQPAIDPETGEIVSSEEIKMPLLSEILGLAYDAGVNLQLELKADSVERIKKLAEAMVNKIVKMRNDGAFVEKPAWLVNLCFFSMSIEGMEHLIAKLEENGLEKAKTFLSWPSNESYAQEMAISSTSIQRAAEIEGKFDWLEKGMEIAKRIGCTGISIHAENLLKDSDYVEKAHGRELEIMAGGSANHDQMVKLRKMGVDRLMSEVLE